MGRLPKPIFEDVSQNESFVAHPFCPQQQKQIQYVELAQRFGRAKVSPRHMDGAFVEVFQFQLATLSFSRTHGFEAVRVPASSTASSG